MRSKPNSAAGASGAVQRCQLVQEGRNRGTNLAYGYRYGYAQKQLTRTKTFTKTNTYTYNRKHKKHRKALKQHHAIWEGQVSQVGQEGQVGRFGIKFEIRGGSNPKFNPNDPKMNRKMIPNLTKTIPKMIPKQPQSNLKKVVAIGELFGRGEFWGALWAVGVVAAVSHKSSQSSPRSRHIHLAAVSPRRGPPRSSE